MREKQNVKLSERLKRTFNALVRFINFENPWKNPFTSKCPKCEEGSVSFVGEDWTGRTWINVYECDKCKTQFM